MALFADLSQLQNHIIASKFCTDRKCRKINPLNHQVLSKCSILHFSAARAEIFNLVKRKQTYLAMPFSCMCITLNAPIFNDLYFRNTLLLCSLRLTCTDRNYFSHKIIPFTFLILFVTVYL